MPSALTVSVIMPTFNRAAYVATAIESILAQDWPIADFVVVDDGSDDDTRAVLASYQPRISVVHQQNQGKVAAIARGLAETRGDLVWIMDDDDIALPGALAALIAPLARDPAVMFSYGHMVKFTTDTQGDMVLGERSDYAEADPRPFLVKLMEDCFITGHPCVLVRRQCYLSMAPFDTGVTASVDYYFHLRIASQGPTALVKEVVLLQRQHGGARGPRAARYGEVERVRRWKQSDRLLIGRMLDDLPLDLFAPAPASLPTDTPLGRRATLIQKAAIAGRKQLWPVCGTLLAEAFAIQPQTRLTPLERHILSRVLGCRYGLDEVYEDPTILDRLRQITALRPREARLSSELGRPLLHQMRQAIREGNAVRLRLALRLWRRLFTRRTLPVAIFDIVARSLRRAILGWRPSSSRPPAAMPLPLPAQPGRDAVNPSRVQAV